MTLMTCTSGSKVSTKTALKVERFNLVTARTTFDTIWFTCPCCKGTFHIKRVHRADRPAKPAHVRKAP